jgi:hypothetical protein
MGTRLRLNKSVLELDYALRQQLINQTLYTADLVLEHGWEADRTGRELSGLA